MAITNELLNKAIDVAFNSNTFSCRDFVELNYCQFKADIARFYYAGIDAYKLARLMDDEGWCVNADFVSDMSCVIECVEMHVMVESAIAS